MWPPLTLHFGPRFVLVNLDIQFVPALRAQEVAGAIERIDRRIRAHYPIVRQIFIEARSFTDSCAAGARAGPPPAPPGPGALDRRDAVS